MRVDPVLRYFVELRNIAVKEGSMPIHQTVQQVQLIEENAGVYTVRASVGVDPPAISSMLPEILSWLSYSSPFELEPHVVYQWTFEEFPQESKKRSDVLRLGEYYFQKLQEIVDDVQVTFG